MLITVQNLTSSILSTDVGSLNPAESKSLTMGPEEAYRTSEQLKSLVDAGYVSVTVAQETAKYDALEPAAVGTASVADGAVTTAKFATGAVDSAALGASAVITAKIDDLAVTTGKINDLAVTAGKIAADAVTTAKILDANVTAAKLATDAVETAKIKANAVTVAKMKVFKSTEQTGTGASQNVAHGLGATPGLVFVVFTADATGTNVVTEGTHDGTNCVVTVTTGAKFKVIAFV